MDNLLDTLREDALSEAHQEAAMHPQLSETIGKMQIDQLHRDAALYHLARAANHRGKLGGRARRLPFTRQALRREAGRPCLDS